VSIVITDRFAEQLRIELEKELAERQERLIRDCKERDAGYIQGIRRVLEIMEVEIRKLNER